MSMEPQPSAFVSDLAPSSSASASSSSCSSSSSSTSDCEEKRAKKDQQSLQSNQQAMNCSICTITGSRPKHLSADDPLQLVLALEDWLLDHCYFGSLIVEPEVDKMLPAKRTRKVFKGNAPKAKSREPARVAKKRKSVGSGGICKRKNKNA